MNDEPLMELPHMEVKPEFVFSKRELKKAVIMSEILGEPVCRRRKRYEGNNHRR